MRNDAIMSTESKRFTLSGPMVVVKRKVRYLVEVDQVEGVARILMTAADMKSALEDILKHENMRCVHYYEDGMPMQKYLDEGKVLQQKIDRIFGEFP